MTPVDWHRAVVQGQTCLKRDDDGFGLFAREGAKNLAEILQAQPGLRDSAPDPDLFDLFIAALTRYAKRSDPIERARAARVVSITADVLCGILKEPAEEAERARHFRGLAETDR